MRSHHSIRSILLGLTALAALCPAAADALVYRLTYEGVQAPLFAELFVTLDADDEPATGISGTRNGVSVTGLSDYAYSDNRVTLSQPYVTMQGLAFTTSDGIDYNLFTDENGEYFEIDSVTEPSGDGYGIRRVVLAEAIEAPATPGAVPEPASWVEMLLGFGLIGAVRRRRGAAVSG